jgi:hypothetical protein
MVHPSPREMRVHIAGPATSLYIVKPVFMPEQIAAPVASVWENIGPAMADQIVQNVERGMGPVELIFTLIKEMVHDLRHPEMLTAIAPHLFRHQALIPLVQGVQPGLDFFSGSHANMFPR